MEDEVHDIDCETEEKKYTTQSQQSSDTEILSANIIANLLKFWSSFIVMIKTFYLNHEQQEEEEIEKELHGEGLAREGDVLVAESALDLLFTICLHLSVCRTAPPRLLPDPPLL